MAVTQGHETYAPQEQPAVPPKRPGPKAELRWREWTAPIDGVELLNPDTSWRVHALRPGVAPKLRLARGLLTYPVRPSETIAALPMCGGATWDFAEWRPFSS